VCRCRCRCRCVRLVQVSFSPHDCIPRHTATLTSPPSHTPLFSCSPSPLTLNCRIPNAQSPQSTIGGFAPFGTASPSKHFEKQLGRLEYTLSPGLTDRAYPRAAFSPSSGEGTGLFSSLGFGFGIGVGVGVGKGPSSSGGEGVGGGGRGMGMGAISPLLKPMPSSPNVFGGLVLDPAGSCDSVLAPPPPDPTHKPSTPNPKP
jgi:hypothetical protein